MTRRDVALAVDRWLPPVIAAGCIIALLTL
jgi:hypothetical protein